MNSYLLALVMILIAETIFNLFLVQYAHGRREVPGAASFSVLSGLIALYTFGYAIELLSSSLELSYFMNGIQYLSIPFIGFANLIVALRYTGKDQILAKRSTFIWLGLLPLVIVCLRISDPVFHWFYTSMTYSHNGFFNYIATTKGPAYYLSSLYLVTTTLVSMMLYVIAFLNSSRHYSGRIFVMLGAVALPWFGSLFNTFQWGPLGIDYAVILLPLSSLLLLHGIYRLEVFESAPISRERVFQLAQEGILIIDRKNRVVDYNQAAKAVFQQLGTQKKPFLLTELNFQFHLLLTTDSNVEFSIFRDSDLRFYTGSLSVLKRYNNSYAGALVLLTDITSLVEARMQLELAAASDPLTAAENRRSFYTKLNYEFQLMKRYSRIFSVLMIDIDYFKTINDTFGHMAGDQVLVELVLLFKKLLRTTDTVARFGGEEFVVLLPETEYQQALMLAERIREETEKMCFTFGDKTIRVTVSVGVSSGVGLVDHVNPSESLLKEVDEALYEAKRKGRNQVVLAPRWKV